MRLTGPLHHGVLLGRYKRFLADVRLEDGRVVTAHCPNSGAMTGCDAAGSRVIVAGNSDPRRKLAYTWELVQVGRRWVGIHSARANAIVGEGLRLGRIRELRGYRLVRGEVACGPGTRLDFLLESRTRRCWLEVKNATLAVGPVAMFPDAVTVRGRKHLRTLARQARRGDRAVLFFLVNRGDCQRFRPASHIDPGYATALGRAVRAGVEVLVYGARVRADSITLERRLETDLGQGE